MINSFLMASDPIYPHLSFLFNSRIAAESFGNGTGPLGLGPVM